MTRRSFSAGIRFSTLVVLASLVFALPAAAIEGKLGLSLIRMEPSGQDAKDFSDPGWGGGLHFVLSLPQLSNMLAGVVGIEYVNLLNENITTYDRQTLLRVEQQTDQYYSRLYLGPEFGPHGNGTFRPHVGADIALVLYGISTDIVVPDDYNREQEIRQSLRDEHRAAFGYDVNLGLDINPWNKVSIDVGARFLKSFNVPQQLGAGSVAINPGYVQGYLGVGLSLGWLGRVGDDKP
jgi:opacity protein-like surface antigen